jgi:hypothetical protein
MSIKTPPPPKKNDQKGSPPERNNTKQNLKKPEPGVIVALNFRVPDEFKRDFKIASATFGITQSELLQQAFKLWKNKNG